MAGHFITKILRTIVVANKTVALAMIVKDEFEQVLQLIERAEPYFDKIYLTVTDGSRLDDFKKLQKAKVKVDYFKWVKDFSKARNHNFSLVKEDYVFWCDADDVLDFSKIPLLLQEMVEDDLDAMYLQYNYAQNEQGECIAMHWRERLLKTSHPFKWAGALHETLLSDGYPRQVKNDQVVIHHTRKNEDNQAQHQRNLEILENAVNQKPRDPRYVMYLGYMYADEGRHQEAIKLLLELVRTSGSKEDIYYTWIRMGRVYSQLGEFSKAVNACFEASKVLPKYPDAYFEMAQHEYDSENWDACIEWLKVGFTKPIPETLHIVDPTQYTHRPRMLGAKAYIEKGMFKDAQGLIAQAIQYGATSAPVFTLKEIVDEEVEKQAVIEALKELTIGKRMPDDFKKKLYEALPGDYKYDPRVYPLRKVAVEPKKWPKKSIVFMCGQTSEDWGPDFYEKGMGGSEEAILNLSRELDKLGYQVTVYNTRSEEYHDGNVTYLPWYTFDTRDEFDTLVLWRLPSLAKGMKARNIFVDLHDVTNPDWLYNVKDKVDKFFVKSKYHRDLFPDLADDKFAIVGNGIQPDHFVPVKKKPNTIGYYSSPDRGLKCLLEMWPKILEKNPDARGHWYYGWETYTNVNGEDQLYHDIKALLKEHEDTFFEGGRVDHETLANIMSETQVWAYPTEFTEIHCITALKAQQAGMVPVATNVAALEETVQNGHKINAKFIYHNRKAQEEFVDTIIEELKSPSKVTPVKGVSWAEVAKQWEKYL